VVAAIIGEAENIQNYVCASSKTREKTGSMKRTSEVFSLEGLERALCFEAY
jgi:hypothetical protein